MSYPMALLGQIAGAALALLALFAIVLAIGKLPRVRNHPLGVHVAATVLVWLLAASITYGPAAAYLVTLIAIWSYRRGMRRQPSGWYRLGAVLTTIWLSLCVVLLLAEGNASIGSDEEIAFMSWFFAALGLSVWLAGWAVQWTREGFSARS